MEFNDYKKYRWFFTSSGKLVVGGKSSIQNDELLRNIKRENKEFLVMHTYSPGSPFSIIVSDVKNITKYDQEEAATFTACFSQAWKSSKKIVKVHSFSSKNIYKLKSMKSGTWGVKKIEKEFSVKLHLVLIKQEGVLRAVPPSTAKKSDILLNILPGKTEKKDLLAKIAVILDDHPSEAEILASLPAGGINILK